MWFICWASWLSLTGASICNSENADCSSNAAFGIQRLQLDSEAGFLFAQTGVAVTQGIARAQLHHVSLKACDALTTDHAHAVKLRNRVVARFNKLDSMPGNRLTESGFSVRANLDSRPKGDDLVVMAVGETLCAIEAFDALQLLIAIAHMPNASARPRSAARRQ